MSRIDRAVGLVKKAVVESHGVDEEDVEVCVHVDGIGWIRALTRGDE